MAIKSNINSWKRGLKNKLTPHPEQAAELGFGSRPVSSGERLINSDGTPNVRRKGDKRTVLGDAYHATISLSWTKFFVILLGNFLVLNILFAITYYLIGTDSLAGVRGTTSFEKFIESFFFSSQTLTTLGYGRISPIGFWASTVAAIESTIGLLAFALSTSLLWGRFSRPTAKILYSDTALVAPFKEGIGLMVRLVNGRRNHLIEIEARMVAARNEEIDGKRVRKFYNLPLELSKVNFLALSWTLVHPIDAASIFLSMDPKHLRQWDYEILVMIKAYDEMYSQVVHSRTSYKADQIIYGAKFITMMSSDGGATTLDMRKLNAYEVVELPPPQV